MKSKNNSSIRSRVFLFYATVIAVIYIIFMSIITIDNYSNSVSEAYELARDNIKIYSDSIDQEILIMDNVAMTTLFSYKTDEYLGKDIEVDDLSEAFSNLESIAFDVTAELASSVSLSYSVHHALVHNNNGLYLSSRSNYFIVDDIKNLSWYSQVVQKNGDKFLTPPYLCSDETMSIDYTTTQYLISLARIINNEYGVQKGVVEVQQYASKIFSLLDNIKNNGMYDEIYVVDEDNNVIYPYNDIESVSVDEYQDVIEALEYDTPSITETGNNLISLYKSHVTDYTLITLSKQDSIIENFAAGIFPYTGISLLGVILVVIFSYYGSSRLTKPLGVLKQRIEGYSVSKNDIYSDNEKIESIESGVTEIDELSYAFDEMHDNLIKSIHELMVEHQQKLQYKMLALQSQMNPHFLHNSLANISALADLKDTEKISVMCNKMSLMLRYISSGKDNHTTIKDEMDFAKDYADILKMRFDNNFECEFDIDESMYELNIPKLSIQPLIENSSKACMQKSNRGKISVIGRVDDQGWYITVSDNGPGFSEQDYNEVFNRIKQTDNANILPEIELDGMGLLNINIRLKLMFKEASIFCIDNNKDCGCTVKIGARFKN